MRIKDFSEKNPFVAVRFFAFVILIAAPALFLEIASSHLQLSRRVDQINLITGILLVLGLVSPLLIPAYQRTMIKRLKKRVGQNENPENLFVTLSVANYAIIFTIYIYGFIVYLLSSEIQRMLYFYPIGIAWTFMHWPTRARYESFVNQ